MKTPKPWDYVIVGIVAVLSLLSLLLFLRPDGETVRVEQNGVVLYTGSIRTDHEVIADGATVSVLGGHVTVTTSDCPDKLCMQGEATATHPLICLPNRLVVTVVSEEVTPDAVSY